MDRAILENLISQGYGTYKIAKAVSKSQTTVRFWLKKYSLTTNNPKYGGRCGELKGRVCSHCGERDPDKFYGNKITICAKCHNKYTNDIGHQKRLKAVEKLGGKCIICGYCRYTGSLDIHHLDPSKKDTKFSQMRGWTWERILKEIDNCVLLCKNCHSELHAGLIHLPIA